MTRVLVVVALAMGAVAAGVVGKQTRPTVRMDTPLIVWRKSDAGRGHPLGPGP
jgi:hypothetical protein